VGKLWNEPERNLALFRTVSCLCPANMDGSRFWEHLDEPQPTLEELEVRPPA
jgi:hypothetical protein